MVTSAHSSPTPIKFLRTHSFTFAVVVLLVLVFGCLLTCLPLLVQGRGIFITDSAQDIEESSHKDFMEDGAIVQPLLVLLHVYLCVSMLGGRGCCC